MIYLDVHAPEPEIITGKKAVTQKESASRTERIVNLYPSNTLKKKTSDKTYCPYCSHESVLIWVHGHYQCSRCKYIVVSCCEAN